MTEREIICIGCPLGCRVNLTINPDGTIENVKGNQCKEGRKYALAECQHPERVLTATVLTEGSARRLLPVRTDRAVPREKLQDIMRVTARVRVKPPVKIGQVIVNNIAETGANLIATGSL